VVLNLYPPYTYRTLCLINHKNNFQPASCRVKKKIYNSGVCIYIPNNKLKASALLLGSRPKLYQFILFPPSFSSLLLVLPFSFVSQKRNLAGRLWCRCEDFIMDLKETEWKNMERTPLAQDREKWRAFMKRVMNFRFPQNAENVFTVRTTITCSKNNAGPWN
jgi:hypothetical protein